MRTEQDVVEKERPTGVVRIDSWQIVCQECHETYENHMGYSIFGGDSWYAIEEARDSDWLVRDGLVVCPACWEKKPYCRDEDDKCLRRDVSEADDGWLYCPDHVEQGMDEPSSIPSGEEGR